MPDHRPHAHLRPETAWTNDPVGPIEWGGRTHLFHQVNPNGGYWDRPHWGHVVSDDLVRWHRRPIALSPDPDGPDANGCYSGSVVVDGDDAVLFYTGVRGDVEPDEQQTTCVARSRDPQLDEWDKDPANPVLRAPAHLDLIGFRDPYVWHEDGRWWQLVGAGIRNVGGAVLLFSSDDLHTWQDEGPMLTATDLDGSEWTGAMWECPTLMRTDRGDVLLLSIHDGETTHYPLAFVGRLERGRFVVQAQQRLDLGPDLYAPCLLRDASGRTVLWAWSWEARSAERQREEGWAGVLSLPRVLELAGDRVHVAPLPELLALREDERAFTRRTTTDGWLADGLNGDRLDLEIVLGPDAQRIELRLRRSPALEEVTRVFLDRNQGELWLDREDASEDPSAFGGRFGGHVDLDADHTELRVVLDRSIIEVFVDGRVTLTARVYPSRADSTGVEVAGSAAAVADTSLRAWTLGSIWDPAPPTAGDGPIAGTD
jgi:beta-fructofuranosidase